MDEYAKQRIKEIVQRVRGKRTQGQAALALGVSPGTIRNWSAGIGSPDLDGLIAISSELKVPLVKLLEEILGEKMIDTHPDIETADQVLFEARKLSTREKMRLIALLAQEVLEESPHIPDK